MCPRFGCVHDLSGCVYDLDVFVSMIWVGVHDVGVPMIEWVCPRSGCVCVHDLSLSTIDVYVCVHDLCVPMCPRFVYICVHDLCVRPRFVSVFSGWGCLCLCMSTCAYLYICAYHSDR